MRNGAPFSKPRVRLFGAAGDAQNYLGAAYNLLFKVRQFCEASGAPVFAMQHSLPDGAVVQAAVLGNEEIVSCFPPTYTREAVEKRPKELPRPLLPLDCGWLQDAVGGVIDDIGGRYSLYVSPECAATIDAMRDVSKGVFKNLFECAEDCASFGENLFYEGYETEADAEQAKDMDIALLETKRRALPLLGAVTGLARQWVCGLFGRPLRDTPTLSFFDGLCIVDWATFAQGQAGVVALDGAFYFVRFNGAVAAFTELEVPSGMGKIAEACLLATGVQKAALATLLLSYAKQGDGVFEVNLPGEMIFPTFGWCFSYFSAKCVGVNWTTQPVDAGGGMLVRVQELSFSTQFDGSVVATISLDDEAPYSNTGSVTTWVPVPTMGELHRLVLPPKGPTPPATLHAYYDTDDNLVRVDAGNTEYVQGEEPRLVSEERFTACGAGESFREQRYEWGTVATQNLRVADIDLTTRFVPAYQELDARSSMTPLTPGNTWAFGTNFWEDSACFRQDGPGADPNNTFFVDGDPLHGTFVRQSITRLGSNSDGVALILPFLYTDSALFTKGVYADETGSMSSDQITNAIQGGRYRNDLTGQLFLEIHHPLSINLPAFTGAGLPPSETSVLVPAGTPIPPTTEVTAEAGAGFSSGTNLTALTDESDSPYTIPLYGFTDAANLGPYLFLPYVVHSLHGEAWGMFHPHYGNTRVAGPAEVLNGIPIGVQ